MQPGKLLIDMLIDFNDCKRFEQLTQQVNPDIKIESGVKIGEVPALVDTGANVIAPVLVSLGFLRTVLPDNCIEQFLSKVKQNVSGADGKDNLAIVRRLSVLLAIRPLDQDSINIQIYHIINTFISIFVNVYYMYMHMSASV